MQMKSVIMAALSMTILSITLVPTVAAMPAHGISVDAQGASSIVVSAIGLSRFGGNQVADTAVPKVLFSSARSTATQFPPSNATLEIPLWLQLLTVSVLLGVFAAGTAEEANSSKDERPEQVQLVRPSAIAARLAGAAGCFAAHEAVISQAVTSSPAWAQLLCASLFLGIFAATAWNSEAESDKGTRKVVKLVKMHAIAGRLAVAAGLFGAPGATRAMAPGLHHIFSMANGSNSFPSSETNMDVPAWVQLLVVSTLLGVFAAAVSDEEDQEHKLTRKKVELVRTPIIAARLSVTAGLFGIHGAFHAASTYFKNAGLMTSQTFPPIEANADVPTWAQCLLVSVLLGVFAAVISDDDAEKEEDGRNFVELVRVHAIAARLAIAAALFGAPGAVRAVAGAFGTSASFATSELSTEVPVWAQFAVASLLLGVFALAVSEDEAQQQKNDKIVNLIQTSAIAARLAVAAGCFALHAAVVPALPEFSFAGLHVPSNVMSSSTTFANLETTMDTPQWCQFLVVALLLGVFAVLASDDDTEEDDSQKAVQLIRVPAIAARLAVAAALFGALGAACAVAGAFGPSANFATSDLTMDVPVWTQLTVVSMLLGVFAIAASEEEENDSETSVKLIRVPAIAGRLAVATGCFAMHAAVMPTVPSFSFSGLQQLSTFGNMGSSSPIFPVAEATLDTPLWAQLLLGSVLLGIFAKAVSEDEVQGNEKTADLLHVPTIAARLGVAAALFGAPGALRAASAAVGHCPSFPLSDLDAEIPVWTQLAVVSLLLGIFAVAVSEDETEGKQDIESGVKLVQVPSIAGRLAIAVGCFAVHAAVVPSVPGIAFAGFKSTFSAAKAAAMWIPVARSPVFASADTMVETPLWTQLLAVSFLLLVFAILVRDESADDKDKKLSAKQAQLVRPAAIAARLGMAAAAFAVREVMPPLDSTALPSDLLAKGGLLVAGTALALSGEIQKSMCAKKVV